MKSPIRIVSIGIIAFFTIIASAIGDDFVVDKTHSAVSFSISHLSISKVRGRFKTFDGNWSLDTKTKQLSALTLDIDVASIDTDNVKRDNHLRNEDFFDAPKHEKMTFRMVKYQETSPGKGKAIGQLTIRGKSQPVELLAEVSKVVDNPWKKGKSKMGISLTGTVDRLAHGVGIEHGDAKIGEKVSISVDLEGDN